MQVNVVYLPLAMSSCDRDPAHEGHAECAPNKHAGKTFVARYSWGSEGNSISEYLTTAGEWLELPEMSVLPDECFHTIVP